MALKTHNLSKLTIAALVAWISLGSVETWGKDDSSLQALDKGEYAIALKEFKELAAAGNPVAMNNLAVMYATGRGVKKSYKSAAKFYMMAAEQGLPIAQYNVGNLYERGLGVEKDMESAAIWYRLAASQGDVLAQLRMGILNVSGEISSQSNVLAYYWLSLAARRTTNMGLRAEAFEQRAFVAGRMTKQEIRTAKTLADQWKPMP